MGKTLLIYRLNSQTVWLSVHGQSRVQFQNPHV